MNAPGRLLSFAWVIVLLLSITFLVWTKSAGIDRVEYLTNLGALVEEDYSSPTGYLGGVRALIVPEHNNDSYQWIMQTQQMLADGEWRMSHVDYDNAPIGREVRSPSPYRWWLAIVSGVQNAYSGDPIGLSVERAALFADAALQILFLICLAALTAWRFGWFAACLVSVGWTFMFPLSGAFLPGAPDDHGLTLIFIVLSVLPLVIGTVGTSSLKQRQRWFFAAGAAGGAGVWVNAGTQLPIFLGIIIGGIAAAFFLRSLRSETANEAPEVLPWRAWAIGGAAVCLAAYLIENFPGRMDVAVLRLQVVHPLHALAWLGAGELLARFAGWMQAARSTWTRRDTAFVVVAVLAMASLPIAVAFHETGRFGVPEPFSNRLTNLPEGATAENFADWYLRRGATTMVWATILPLILIAPALWLMARKTVGVRSRVSIMITLGPVLVLIIFAFVHLRWWNMLDGALLVLLVASVAAIPITARLTRTRGLWVAGTIVCLAPGFFQLTPQGSGLMPAELTHAEAQSLLERNLSLWLATRAGEEGAVILAPPNLTTSICFHGGLRGLGSPYWENKDGFVASIRIAGASSPDEAQALVRQREVTQIVLPSWDSFLDEYAKLGTNDFGNSLVGMLERWLPPRWLKPAAFHPSEINGVERESAVVFDVVEVQDNATALSRLAEFFVETEQLKLAEALSQTLENSFPSNLGALIARAQVAFALRDGRRFNEVIETLMPYLSGEMDESLPWDRRVSLALMLAQARQIDPARRQLEYCLDEVDEYLLRSLSPASLYRLRLLIDALGMEMPDPKLDNLTRKLLPKQLRDRLPDSR